jgi:hypothetical protein
LYTKSFCDGQKQLCGVMLESSPKRKSAGSHGILV